VVPAGEFLGGFFRLAPPGTWARLSAASILAAARPEHEPLPAHADGPPNNLTSKELRCDPRSPTFFLP
jgi:hypothetical protein